MSEELSNAFCVSADENWFRAVMQKLEDHIADAQLIVVLPTTAQNHGTIASAAGRLDALLTLREDLQATRNEAFEKSKQ